MEYVVYLVLLWVLVGLCGWGYQILKSNHELMYEKCNATDALINQNAALALSDQRAEWAVAMLLLALCCRLNRVLPAKARESAKKKRAVIAVGPGTPVVIEAKKDGSDSVLSISLLKTTTAPTYYEIEIYPNEPGYRQVESLLYERDHKGVQGLELYTDHVYRRLYLAFKGLELIRFNLDWRKYPVEYSSKINTAVDDVVALLMNEKEEL